MQVIAPPFDEKTSAFSATPHKKVRRPHEEQPPSGILLMLFGN
jgi:hypothetical protein